MYFQTSQTVCTEDYQEKESMKEITTKLFSCGLNKNGRVYPKEVMENALENLKENGGWGLLCHPGTEYGKLEDSIGKVDEIKMDENGDVLGKVLLFDNPSGKACQTILDTYGKSVLHITPAGYGEVDKDGVIKYMNISHFNIDIMKEKSEEKNTVVIPNIDSLKNVTVKFKKLDENAVIPSYAHDGDVGMDITATMIEYDVDKDLYIYHTGLTCETEFGYGIFLFPRSSNCKTEAYLTNHVGIVDSAIYRGEIQLRYKNRRPYRRSIWEILTGKINHKRVLKFAPYQPGDRVGQMVVLPYPKVNIKVVDELSETERGTGGFGSTGK